MGLDVEGGASYFDEMQALAKELHIDGKTTWTGAFKSEEEEASLYLHASDVWRVAVSRRRAIEQ